MEWSVLNNRLYRNGKVIANLVHSLSIEEAFILENGERAIEQLSSFVDNASKGSFKPRTIVKKAQLIVEPYLKLKN